MNKLVDHEERRTTEVYLNGNQLVDENKKLRAFIETIANEGICAHPCTCDTSDDDLLCRTGRARKVLK